MKNKFYLKYLVAFFTILSILSLSFFNYYMSSYYDESNIEIYTLNPVIIFFIVLIIVSIQILLVYMFNKNK